ncbi:hypothetical protein Taro_049338 [Colocasia esculenta]|uniref:RING-type domain-containing protein n=1 Tax=Colocasia esculenta TaxID=4460 RepID=A0A843XAN7_COLES|nr:hypothetical protein [Colocasia esculenta]
MFVSGRRGPFFPSLPTSSVDLLRGVLGIGDGDPGAAPRGGEEVLPNWGGYRRTTHDAQAIDRVPQALVPPPIVRRVLGRVRMNTRVSSRRPSKRRTSEANSSNGKRVLNVDTYVERGAPHVRIRMQDAPVMTSSAVPATDQPFGQQATRSNLLIDVEAIEDDVQMLSPSGGFSQGQNQSRRNLPVTIVLDEDSDVQAASSGVTMEDLAVTVTANNRNRQKLPPKRTIINCETYENVDFGHKTKKKCVMNATEPPKAAPKEPVFTCAICWGKMVDETSTICGHIFCQGCIKAAIQAQKKCPTCRRSLTMKNIHRVFLPSSN